MRLLAGLRHKIWFREDGTVWACYGWSNPQRRKDVQFKTLPDGSLAPLDRGRRRTDVVDDLVAILRAHGVAVTSRQTPGPRSGLPPREIVADVDQLRSQHLSVDAACRKVAAERGYSPDSVRRRYWTQRKDLRKHTEAPPTGSVDNHYEGAPQPTRPSCSHTRLRSLSDLASEAGADSLCGPLLSERIRQLRSKRGLTFAQASASLAAKMGWTSEQLLDRLVGTWKSTPGGWTRIDENESESVSRA